MGNAEALLCIIELYYHLSPRTPPCPSLCRASATSLDHLKLHTFKTLINKSQSIIHFSECLRVLTLLMECNQAHTHKVSSRGRNVSKLGQTVLIYTMIYIQVPTPYKCGPKLSHHITHCKGRDAFFIILTPLMISNMSPWYEDIITWPRRYCETSIINSLKPRLNRRHFEDDIFKCISWVKLYLFRLTFQWSLFPRVQLTLLLH